MNLFCNILLFVRCRRHRHAVVNLLLLYFFCVFLFLIRIRATDFMRTNNMTFIHFSLLSDQSK